MIEGIEADDKWIMVEDEQYATARLFTRHLHQAEYLRQKELARTRNEGKILNIERPVDGRTAQSIAVSKKLQASRQAQKARAAVRNITGTDGNRSEPEEDDPWLRDPRLAGLMSQKEPSIKLAKITGSQSSSRAAKGFSQGRPSPTKKKKYAAVEDESTRVDYRSREAPPSPLSKHRKAFMDSDSEDLDSYSFSSKSAAIKSEVLSSGSRSALRNQKDTRDLDDDGDLFDSFFLLQKYKPNECRPFGKSHSPAKEKAKDKPVKVEEVPTFLF